jgi:hypothetical protein
VNCGEIQSTLRTILSNAEQYAHKPYRKMASELNSA